MPINKPQVSHIFGCSYLVFNINDFSLLQKQHCDFAQLVLIPNPEHHPQGGFHLSENGQLSTIGTPTHTYIGIGLFRPHPFNLERSVGHGLIVQVIGFTCFGQIIAPA